jgi:hypothetical protein
MMPRNRTAIALVAIASLSQCGAGLGDGSQIAIASPSRRVLTQRQAVAIRNLKFPQSSNAMAKRFGPPSGISRDQFSSRYVQHYADRVQPVEVEFRWDGVAIGLAGEGQ